MNERDGFTFYGDLLGIGTAYKLGAKVAYDKLDTFYKTAFAQLAPLCDGADQEIHVQMFSDSLVVWGYRPRTVLGPLQAVYLKLVSKGLLLRGALVRGALQKEPRIEANAFKKFLPADDTLARAVGLESTVKGARFLIEPDLALELMRNLSVWLTLEGYMDNPRAEIPKNDILRRICPSPSGTSYELLYFWATADNTVQTAEFADRLKELAEFQDSHVREHLRETVRVLRRSELRRQRTERMLGVV